jgi:hypothetical protein
VQASAPEVCALKVNPAASSAFPLEQIPEKNGDTPTGTVLITVLLAVSMIATSLLLLLVT